MMRIVYRIVEHINEVCELHQKCLLFNSYGKY